MREVGFALFLVMLTVHTFGQAQSKTLKFDEFEISTLNSGYAENQVDVTKRIERLVDFVKQMSGSKVFVVVYHAQKDDESKHYALRFWFEETSKRLINEGKLNPDQVRYVRGGYRDEYTIEYWIGHNGSQPPIPSPKYKDSERFGCPEMKMNAFASRGIVQSDPATFTLWINPAQAEAKFSWTISVGKILEGQGSQTITVDPEGNRRMTVIVEVIGLPLPCTRVAFITIDFDRMVPLHESISTQNLDVLNARISYLIQRMRFDLQGRAYLIVYERRDSLIGQSGRAMGKVKKIFADRNYDMTRVKLINGGHREDERVEFWVLPEGADLPKPTPTVDESLVVPPKTKTTTRKRY
ncbi:MAG: hypothetical protein WBD16_06525 [Pyrinomonadaceae bacterium]